MYNNKQRFIEAFKAGIFPYVDGFRIKEESEEEPEEELEKLNIDFKRFIEYIKKESKDLNYDLFKEYFIFSVASALAKKLYEIKNKTKNNELLKAIKNKWSNLKAKLKRCLKMKKN